MADAISSTVYDQSGTSSFGTTAGSSVSPPLPPTIPSNDDATPDSTTIYGLVTVAPPLIAPGNMDNSK